MFSVVRDKLFFYSRVYYYHQLFFLMKLSTFTRYNMICDCFTVSKIVSSLAWDGDAMLHIVHDQKLLFVKEDPICHMLHV